MKKIVEINSVCNGSTGKIMCDIAKNALEKGMGAYCFFGRGKPNESVNCIKIESKLTFLFHTLIGRLGFNGHGSYFSTKRMVRKIRKINPDVIHMHNIHGYYLNLKVLFNYLKNEYNGKIIWTLHDCWSFTGHCSYFTMINCNKWQEKCYNCPQLSCYPKELFDTTKREYVLKKKLFCGLKNMTIITPSIWLKNLVEKSFLKEYPVNVIHNDVNLDIFKPTFDNNIYDKYSISKDKKVILGVANIWEERKGLKDFIELWNVLDKDKYQIVIIGADDKAKKDIPSGINVIERTDNALELAKIYSLSYVFFNPTYEDNYPTTNIESIACHTPIITYDTGGCKEQIDLYNAGFIINKKDYKDFIEKLDKIDDVKKKMNTNVSSGFIDLYFKYFK